ncbi:MULTISPECIES: PadR family transcriptional regulator [unclassified Thalassospira]|uniref:PadR family transcriptional regulator n=1 Tax=unclassified Thalassospira TaxID=2648997 RepID=UPI000A1EAB49|nr:PadR family transcriptional regulator [Thalassospira sp. MCCC 1A01428]OSQ33962.1 PadR family transcriptional regulator [Thalassospira sp. MCCC 1A01428]
MDIRSLCLGALMAGDASGYEIRKMFEDGVFSFFQMASLGSIYPALTKLSQDGLVTFTEQEQENRPDKKVYRLTAEGRRSFLRTLFQTRPGEDRYRSDILFMLSFADELPVELCEALIDEYAARQELMLDRISSPDKHAKTSPDATENDAAHHDAGCEFISGLGDAVCRATLDFIAKNKQPFLADIRKRRSRKP